jgi:hypothetical protein
MTPEQALNILSQIVAQVSMPLQGHQQAQEAIRILKGLVDEKAS